MGIPIPKFWTETKNMLSITIVLFCLANKQGDRQSSFPVSKAVDDRSMGTWAQFCCNMWGNSLV